ncbi:related to asparagine synthases [Cephalotrichum gorgonifer]|uniref:Related to asparagine synthases n=1 Tax=Cephalotrichum gorgonifer TaxID=2041049 RepID=A0AAE8MSB8_9PEZI|nr:related to asparagine synthases [Cephalotrichum gorgonifer]
MCGIFASVSRRKHLPLSAALQEYLANRGPDHTGNVLKTINPSPDDPELCLYLTCVSTVLSLRGQGVTPQPLVSQTAGSILCWNGEAWKIEGHAVAGNDGARVLAALESAVGLEATLDVLRAVEGPFAFIYYDPRDGGRIYFGRDRLGRRSLLVHDQGDLILSSVADPGLDGWAEVEADGVYVLDVGSLGGDVHAGTITMRMAERHGWLPAGYEDYMSNIGLFNTTLPPDQRRPRYPESQSVESLREHLVRSLSLRVLNVPRPHLDAAHPVDTRIAVLFSGGLDCTVVARLASELLPPDQGIDLLNVAFENPRIAATLKPANDDPTAIYELCPDRITGRKSFGELCRVCPERQWRFISSHRSQVVALMHPHNTEMDLSIAYALYFAARGRGLAETAAETNHAAPYEYATTARVLLSGLGADELFGGYVRHATAFSRRGYHGLIEELKLDVGRLGKRNLGRDDRVMSHWGREIRFPFLDENLVKWALEAPVWEKCDFAVSASAVEGEDGGEVGGNAGVEPDKRVLRLLALQLGMASVSGEKKRAIQFGSRTAKMESGKIKGTHLITR